jgi:hypothetical protein
MSTEMDLVEPTNLSVSIAPEDSEEAVPYSSKLVRSKSFMEEGREPFLVYPACLEFQSHGTCEYDMSCVGLDSATSALPSRSSWILPRGVRLREFSTVLSGNVSMNNDEIVAELSRVFYLFATDPSNQYFTPEEYEEKIEAFRTEIQRLLLKEVPDDISTQIKDNAKIIDKYNRGVKRESAVETFRDLVNYADLLLRDSQFIASYKIYDGDIDGFNIVPLKTFTRGENEHKSINLKKAPTNWTITYFQGSPIQTYTKPHPHGFMPKVKEDGKIDHTPKSMWNSSIAERENTNEEVIKGLIGRGYTVFDILDNTCQTAIDKIDEVEIVREGLFRRIRDAEKEKIQQQRSITDQYLRKKTDLLREYNTSGKSKKDLDKFNREKNKALEYAKKKKLAAKKEIDLLLKRKIKLLPVIDKFKEKVVRKCNNAFIEGGKKTRRMGSKMTVKKSIRSKMKKTRNKKMYKIKKGRKTRKY